MDLQSKFEKPLKHARQLKKSFWQQNVPLQSLTNSLQCDKLYMLYSLYSLKELYSVHLSDPHARWQCPIHNSNIKTFV